MPFEWPSSDQICYRLWRLRRLLALCLLVPAAVGLALAVGGHLPVDHVALALVLIGGLVMMHLVLFPNGTHETLGLTLALSGLLAALPWVNGLGALAPADFAQAGLVFAVTGALVATGLGMAVLVQLLKVLTFIGPSLRLPLRAQTDVGCSVAVALQQFAIKPQIRRGRILTGQADARGFFDVAVASAQDTDPDHAGQPLVGRATAKVLYNDSHSHAVLLLLPCGAISVSALHATPQPAGCRVDLAELAGDFTLGMYVRHWLTDQQADVMTEVADRIIGAEPRANALAHGVSFLSLAGLVLSPSEPVADRAK